MDNRPVALVTGAGQGIGRAIAIELARQGLDIVGVDLRFEPGKLKKGLGEVKGRAEEAGAAFLPLAADIADLAQHPGLLAATLKRFSRLDWLVNNAGVAPLERLDILQTSPPSYDRVMAVNARGPYFLTQHVARYLIGEARKDPRGSRGVVFITSVSAEVSSPERAEYCVSKAALSHTARLYADRLAEFGIPVYEIRPGIIQTDMTAPVKGKYDRLIKEGLVPQKRWGLPEDVARAVAALIGGAFAFSTGLVLEVSGGMNIRRL